MLTRHDSSPRVASGSLLTLAAALALVAVVLSPALAVREASSAADAAAKAGTLLERLSAEERAAVLRPMEEAILVDWHFIPKDERKGLLLSAMSQEQQLALLELMRTLVSETGEQKTRGAMKLEALVAELEGDDRRWARDPEMYSLTLLGDPATFGQPGSRWAISYEGHHVSLNFVLEGDRVIDSTPQFLGAHPAEVKTDNSLGVPVGYRLLGPEEQLAYDLVATFDESQRSRAIIDATAPREVLTAGQAKPLEAEPAGLPSSEMSAEQRDLLLKLVHLYTDVATESIAGPRRAAIREAEPSAISFAWAGSDQPGEPHYYRIEGPSFEIELANTQPDASGYPANHLHAMYRDNRGDFGLDEPQ